MGGFQGKGCDQLEIFPLWGPSETEDAGDAAREIEQHGGPADRVEVDSAGQGEPKRAPPGHAERPSRRALRLGGGYLHGLNLQHPPARPKPCRG